MIMGRGGGGRCCGEEGGDDGEEEGGDGGHIHTRHREVQVYEYPPLHVSTPTYANDTFKTVSLALGGRS